MYFNRHQMANVHYKMYKVGKNWSVGLIAGVAVMVGLGMGQAMPAAAATNDPPQAELAENGADKVAPATVPEATDTNEEPAEPVAESKLEDTYDDAQTQVDEANGKSAAVNESQERLQELLDQADLTSQADWQNQLQKALDEYQQNANSFNDAATKAQELIDAYQAKINDTIKEQPNAVKEVTHPDGTTGSDYQQAVTDFQAGVTKQVAAVQDSIANYDVSVQVNQVGADLTDAAGELTAALKDLTITDENLQGLKETYDDALTAYNSAVVAYNDQTGGDIAVIKSEDIADWDQVLADRQVQRAYAAANARYEDISEAITAYQNAVSGSRGAIDAYNAALRGLSETVDSTDLKTKQQAIVDAIDQVAKAQNDYKDFVNSETNQQIIQAYLTAINEQSSDLATYQAAYEQLNTDKEAIVSAANEALANLQGQLADWQKTYQAYLDAVIAAEAQSLPDFGNLATAVEDQQTVVATAIDGLMTSQDAYQAALTAYQQALTASGQTTQASDNKLPDLSALRQSLEANQSRLAAAETLAADFRLQQRLARLNTIIDVINGEQAMLKTLYNAAFKADTWSVLTQSFSAIGDDLANKATDFAQAINGENGELSYADLLAASSDDDAYPAAKAVADRYQGFSDKLTAFKETYDKFVAELAVSAPDEANNQAIAESMRDPKRFSTNGWTTGVEDGSDFDYTSGISTVSLRFYFGDNLNYFLNPARDHQLIFQSYQNILFDHNPDSGSNDLEFKFREGESEENGDVPLYAVFSSEKRAEIEAVLRSVGPYCKNPKDDDQTYYLTGFWSSGLAKGESGGWFGQSFPQGEAERQDFYVFTSLDPIAEFMDLLTGKTPDPARNQNYYFMYTASPKITTNFVDDDALPEVAELTAEISTPDELKTADAPVVSAPNEMKQETITLPGGAQVETEISTLTMPQAPTVTLNHIQEPATNPGTPGITPTDSGDTQSENPDAGQPDVTPPSATADEGAPATTPIKAPGNDTVANGEVQKLGLMAAGVKVHQQATSGSDQPVTTGWAGDQQAGRMAANDVRSAGAADALATKASNSVATSLPQTDEQRSGLAAWIGSWLLALAGVSLIKRRKKQD